MYLIMQAFLYVYELVFLFTFYSWKIQIYNFKKVTLRRLIKVLFLLLILLFLLLVMMILFLSLLFCHWIVWISISATMDQLLLVSTNGNVLRTISMETPSQPGSYVKLDCFVLTAQNEVCTHVYTGIHMKCVCVFVCVCVCVCAWMEVCVCVFSSVYWKQT